MDTNEITDLRTRIRGLAGAMLDMATELEDIDGDVDEDSGCIADAAEALRSAQDEIERVADDLDEDG